jgi:hypothetical protein
MIVTISELLIKLQMKVQQSLESSGLTSVKINAQMEATTSLNSDRTQYLGIINN